MKKECKKLNIINKEYDKAKEIAYKFMCESQPFCYIYSFDKKTYGISSFYSKIPKEVVYVEFIHRLK